MQEQLLGASNKFFYYTMSQGATFNIRIILTIPSLQIKMLQEAMAEALKYYPELAVKIMVRENKLISVRNTDSVLFVPKDDKVRHFGTKDTNGYLFYVSYEADNFNFSYYHGLTDAAGAMEFMRCVMYLYAKRIGFVMSREEVDEIKSAIRLGEDDFGKGDYNDLLDPYNTHKDTDAAPEFVFENEAAYDIPTTVYPDDTEYIHEAIVNVKTSEVISKAKALETSVMALLNDVCSIAIRREFEPKDKPVIAMVPVNLRPLCNSHTIVNCSDGVLLPVHEEDEKADIKDRCAKWKSLMKNQMSEACVKSLMASKAGAVESFENGEVPFAKLANEMTNPKKKGDKLPFSYALSYPGKLTLLTGLDKMISNCEVKALVKANAVIVHSFKEDMRLQVLCQTDDMRLADCVKRAFGDYGILAQTVDNKRVYFDHMMVDELENYYDEK